MSSESPTLHSKPSRRRQRFSTPLKSEEFICGVVEGFYGKPWTTEQRKDLFAKLQKWGINSYLYAPKDDYKHRAFWRVLYTVEEAEHLSSLIKAAKEHDVTFYFAVSPGLDITYSSPKDVAALKRKLDQVKEFGCEAFALLFDDIVPEMSKSDKEVFQTFAHAQVSVTNDIYQHLGSAKFLFCPTQYCGSMAIPDVMNSEYLSIVGEKLDRAIDIFWTGAKVISKQITLESIEQLGEILRRPPVIWDNLHANDYDHKRVFLGPYSGRSPNLIPYLRGVLSNPNCEYECNFVGIHTLAQWVRCYEEAKRDTSTEDPESQPEFEDDGPRDLPGDVYHPRRALKLALLEWAEEFKRPRVAAGAITMRSNPLPNVLPLLPPKSPTPPVETEAPPVVTAPVDDSSLPIVQVNSCDSETIMKTQESSPCHDDVGEAVLSSPTVETVQDQNTVLVAPVPEAASALTEVPPIGSPPTEATPECVLGPSSSEGCEPMDLGSTTTLPTLNTTDSGLGGVGNEIMDDEETSSEGISSAGTVSPIGSSNYDDYKGTLSVDDLMLLVDLFYLPFEHGAAGLQLLNEFHWLKMNAKLASEARKEPGMCRAEVQEWIERAAKFGVLDESLKRILVRLSQCPNRSLVFDLYPFVWDIRGVVSLLNSYVKWLGTVALPDSYSSFVVGMHTWFAKGWKESFMSGDQEPWVFRGGLIADLQRLIPVNSPNDLFVYSIPPSPLTKFYTIRQYRFSEEGQVYEICRQSCNDGEPADAIFDTKKDLIPDRVLGGYLTLSPEFCFVVEDDRGNLCGYAVAALNARKFRNAVHVAWLPELRRKYPMESGINPAIEEMILLVHSDLPDIPDSVYKAHNSVVRLAVLRCVQDVSIPKRLLTCLLAALRSQGSFGAYVEMSPTDKNSLDFYTKLGFAPIPRDEDDGRTFVGRNY
ncbi:unnamed protein product [Cyprideis torosa]|uniref:protein O-GlcNAcase n=1 Tax=Cyprideis torosa TaxID=163714 RepID=A0A7R8W3R9_9CRUS|nr:unnamed protein product [Cyprideis torosa]CAG0883171.1 unnamed protein product [Cyprideis torosa]